MAKSKNRSKAAKTYLDELSSLGCVVCLRLTGKCTPAEIHHTRSDQGVSTRSSDYDAIPLCPRHHRNGNIGEAFHSGAQTWQEKFGTEKELLEWIRNEYKRVFGREAPLC